MGKANNLGDFMTDLADAIREKTGTAEPISPQDFSQKIKDIKGGVAAVESNDVDFVDYDGTILYSYSKEAFLSLAEMPPLPEREGMIYQEWNWRLDEAQEYVLNAGGLIIGANCTTNDNSTRLHLVIPRTSKEVTIYFKASSAFEIDWGDGTIDTISSLNSYTTASHTYLIGDREYCVTLRGGKIELGNGSSYSVMGDMTTASINIIQFKKLIGINVGNNCGYMSSFSSSYLEYISFPSPYSSNLPSFKYCSFLKCVVIPRSITGLYLPNGFGSTYALSQLSLPPTISTLTSGCLESLYGIYGNRLYLSPSITELMGIGYNRVNYLFIPKSVTEISSKTFNMSHCLQYADFSSHTSVPTLNSSAITSSSNSHTKYIVPDALYDTWKAATNWSAHASKIIKKSEWDTLNV